MRRLKLAELEQIRRTPGLSVLLFLTDRCPVGCAHCSVDSRADSPTITDFELFQQIVDVLCTRPELQVVGISGGEPFVERRGLTLASRQLVAAGKDLVVYTSGVWATGSETPDWIRRVLRSSSCAFLSTDAFHAAALADERFVRAARACLRDAVWVRARTPLDYTFLMTPLRIESILSASARSAPSRVRGISSFAPAGL